MRKLIKFTVIPVLLVVLLVSLMPAALAGDSRNPLVDPYKPVEARKLANNMLNILLLGIDYGREGYWGSGGTRAIELCHTDAVMVVAINLDTNHIDLVSLPRDTLTYVPGVRGIYKLNAAFDCASSLEEGLQKTKGAAEWLLGGVQIDYLFAVDMGTMIDIGNLIGGVEMDSEMTYYGHNNTRYKKGLQHMDGYGITDYLRARMNATVNYNDIGRTNRQRQMMLAIFRKLRTDETAVRDIIDTATQYGGFYTDITAADMVRLIGLLPAILAVEPDTIGTHVLTGNYRSTLDWNFTYTDQDHRIAVLKTVFGFDAEPIPYVSTKYAKWLLEAGFSAAHVISTSQQMQAFIAGLDAQALTTEQQEACAAFEDAYQKAVATFKTAADTMNDNDTLLMKRAKIALRDAANTCAQAIGYTGLSWQYASVVWWEDTFINEYQVDWR